MSDKPAETTEVEVDKKSLPLVYSCSGCSSAAQTTNYLAIQLDRRHLAEMSCIAGVGGDVPKLVKVAKSGRPIIAMDGCALACVKSALARHGLKPDSYHQLQNYGVEKELHMDFDEKRALEVLDEIIKTIPGKKEALKA